MDDNKIELVVELDTKKAERQAEDLSDMFLGCTSLTYTQMMLIKT